MSKPAKTITLPRLGDIRIGQTIGLLIIVAIAMALPFIVGMIPVVPYRSVFSGLAFGFAALGVAMLLRHLHLVSFGHAAFFATGAYTVAVLINHFEITNLFLLLIIGTVIGGVMAMIIGLFVKSHLAIFFSLLTLAFNQVLYALVVNSEFLNYTDGLTLRVGGQRPDLFGVVPTLEFYNLFLHYFAVILLAVGLYLMWRIGNSPFGRTLYAIGQDRTRAEFIGINAERYVFIAFVISGTYAGLGGSLWALYELHVQPEPILHVFRSGEMLFMAILGGFETILGPVIGSVILGYLLDAMHVQTTYYHAVTGFLLIAVVFLLPRGIMGIDFEQKFAAFRDDPTVVVRRLAEFGRVMVSKAKNSKQEIQQLLRWK